MKRTYLDYAASAPVDKAVEKAMKPYFGEIFGNPSSLHSFGQEASRAVFVSRQTIAKAIGADYKEVIFTGSATEANNLALRGVVGGLAASMGIVKGLGLTTKTSNHTSGYNQNPKPRIVVSAIEHESVLETARDLSRCWRDPAVNNPFKSVAGEKEGVEVIYIPVSREGIIDLKKLKAALNERTVLVSVMYANNEVGSVQPIAEIANLIRDFKKSHPERQRRISRDSSASPQNDGGLYPLFHTDAVQAFQYLDCDVRKLGVDLMTLSAHKIYGPKGIGALYVRQESRSKMQDAKQKAFLSLASGYLHPVITGGSQEFGLRSGTENTAAIVGFAKAVEITEKLRNSETKRIKKLRDYFWRRLSSLRGAVATKQSYRSDRLLRFARNDGPGSLPNILNVYFPGQKAKPGAPMPLRHRAQELLIKLDLAGIAVSAGAACSTRTSQKSYVLEAMGFKHDRCSGSLRFSLGRQTTKVDIDYAITAIMKMTRD